MSAVADVLGFWLADASDDAVIDPRHPCYLRWFKGGKPVDDEIRRRFAADVEAARTGAYDRWADDDRGLLALIILLDQFPRHLYRQDPRAFDSDPQAYALSRACIETGRDDAYPLVERVFLYLPIQHSERIRDHELAVERFMRMVTLAAERGAACTNFCQSALQAEVEHVDTLRRFGRYPYRNPALGRISTPAEADYLAKLAAPAP